MFLIVLTITGYLFFAARQLENRVAILESKISPSLISETGKGGGKLPEASFPAIGEFQEINGVVTGIQSNQIVIAVKDLPQFIDISNPVPPLGTEKSYTVIISKSTALNALLLSGENQSEKTPLANAGEIKVGDSVRVTSGQDLKNKTEFTAKEIIVFR